MPIIAKFSNGHTDIYKGSRSVKAAWMVRLPSGKVLSGHSISRSAAQKTATSTISDSNGVPPIPRERALPPEVINTITEQFGVSSVSHAKKVAKQLARDFLAKCTIEVIDL